nr:hypothetical protein [Tanacetum cinerariifolium]
MVKLTTFALMCKAYGGEPSVDLLRAFLNLGPAEMDIKCFMMEEIDGEFHFLPKGGAGDEGSSYSTKSVKNEALDIDVEPLNVVHPLELAKNIGDSSDASSEKDEVTLIDRTVTEKAQNQKVSASSKAVGKRKQTAESFFG